MCYVIFDRPMCFKISAEFLLMKSLMDSPSLSKPLPRLRLQSELFENLAAERNSVNPRRPSPLPTPSIHFLAGLSFFLSMHRD
jgi:hypothetical protein